MQELQDAKWIDSTATKMQLAFFTYNAQSSFYVVSILTFERNKFGAVDFGSRYEAFSADPYNTVYPYKFIITADAIFLFMVSFLFISEIMELFPILCRNGIRKGCGLYWNFWNIVDWFNIFTSVIICMVYFVAYSAVAEMNVLIQEIPITNLDNCLSATSTCDQNLGGGISVLSILDDCATQAIKVGLYFYFLRGIVVAFSLSTMLAFFKSFRANPRLRVVTDTLVEAKQDFVHFLVVFISIFLVFVLSGYILFGNRVKLFSSAGNAIDTCAMMCLGFVLDDVREDMIDAFPVLGVVWIWLFYIVLSILLFNMILAIIFDVYGDVKSKVGDAETIFEQAKDLFSKKRQAMESARRSIKRNSLIYTAENGRIANKSDAFLYCQKGQSVVER